MGLNGQVCCKGIWDETIPGIKFDHEGVSNYAHLFDNLCKEYPRGIKGNAEWEKIVKNIKRKKSRSRYDCIIGVSGGTDSSYLLYIAKEKYKLRPLAVNLDNGWSSEIAVKNIKKITTALSIDLETYVIDYEEIKDLLKVYMYSGLPWIDIPTDLAIKAILYKIAAREKVSFILRGNDFRSEGSQPDEWTYGDGRQLNVLHKRFGKIKLKTFPNYTLFSLLYYSIIKNIKSIYPYYYIDYNKSKAQQFLVKEFNWEYYGGHHHENSFTKFAITYWLYEKFGIDKRKITYSAQILSKEITREYALNQISKSPYDTETINHILTFTLKKLDITKEEFEKIMDQPNHCFREYPSYYFLFDKMFKITSFFLNFVFSHKPQSIFQYEMRKSNQL